MGPVNCLIIIDLDTADQPLLRILPAPANPDAPVCVIVCPRPTRCTLPRPAPPRAQPCQHPSYTHTFPGTRTRTRAEPAHAARRLVFSTTNAPGRLQPGLNPKRQRMILPPNSAAAHLDSPDPPQSAQSVHMTRTYAATSRTEHTGASQALTCPSPMAPPACGAARPSSWPPRSSRAQRLEFNVQRSAASRMQ